jgi:hypothetical protein
MHTVREIIYDFQCRKIKGMLEIVTKRKSKFMRRQKCLRDRMREM